MTRTTTTTRFDSQQIGIFLMRTALGVMFLAHGLTKLLVFTLPGTAQFFASVGFPAWLAYPATFAEIIGGAMLLAGIMPRWVAGVLTVQLAAASTVHFGNGWAFGNQNGGWEYPVFLTVTAAAVALLGDGALTLVRSRLPKR
ncbi:putative oxidoreductase [Andreprevotia lacus DSM 23236]|jgi:putative oxidoreductase|uniref:Putative oxidoreductase n=1 Tax=Andreprevotia lacus DSM 23236 TaxID=1121001 RepID=A0A1W1X5H2_9NEIS|nr:DoxX family protein [Andreprevotia lacus]SMC19194.1 putative oxidoreductase [Andreprevotia lacus DSM 23236]